MKALLRLLLTSVLLNMSVSAKELTREEALKIGQDNEGVGNGKFWFEHGDSSPPFVHGGHMLIDRGGGGTLTVNKDGGEETVWVDAPFADGSQTRLDFFTSTKGNGWVTAHVLKPEVKIARPEPAKDARSPKHRALSPAAELAIREGDLEFLKTLFKRGLQINEALDFETGDTLLHAAVASGNLEVVKFLLREGAKPDARNRQGDRPINCIISHEHSLNDEEKSFCKLLANPQADERKIDGIPAGIIEEVLPHRATNELYFISWNGQDPSAALLEEIRKSIPKAKPKSTMETLKRAPLGASSSYEDKETHEFGRLIEVSLKADREDWNATVRTTEGPIMAGGGSKGKLRKAYGYWLHFDEQSWDE